MIIRIEKSIAYERRRNGLRFGFFEGARAEQPLCHYLFRRNTKNGKGKYGRRGSLIIAIEEHRMRPQKPARQTGEQRKRRD
mmetsp:Transcript_8053/g.17322  ORF Transcript_8053/g.17322 Transcript_8053/m.17322 type:complete len:81 (+) Transcript_8053:630-872(+)